MGNRRSFIKKNMMATAGITLLGGNLAWSFSDKKYKSLRPAPEERTFVSKVVDETIIKVKKGINNPN